MRSDKIKLEKRIGIIANTSWYLYNFRKNLIKELINSGCEVIAIAPSDEFSIKLEALGCIYEHIDIDSKSKNPLNDISIFINFFRIFNKRKPGIILNFTAKPNIYATISGKCLNISAINNIAGLGSGFVNETFTTKILRSLYKFSQRRANHVFFQNSDDQQEFTSKKLVNKDKTSILPGSGVDLDNFKFIPVPSLVGKKIKFLLISRMLYSKGIKVLFEAGKKLYDEGYRNFEIQLLGQADVNNDDAIPISILEKWQENSFLTYLGKTDDIRPFLSNAHILVLPSYYREGTPKSILEGLAIGRPIITTDMPGCRTTVIEGENGFIIPPRDVNSLVERMKRIIKMDFKDLERMGMKSRELAEERFDENIVIAEYLRVINTI